MKKTPLFLLPIASICACSTGKQPLVSKEYYFSSLVEVKLYDGTKEDIDAISSILNRYDKLSDNYKQKGTDTSVYTLNQSNDEQTISSDLHDLLEKALELKTSTNGYFEPLIGSLSKHWKESLKNKQALDQMIIEEDLNDILNSNLILNEDTAKRVGDAEIDLGAIAKGYTLDKIKEYLDSQKEKQYLISAGSSSILIGEKNTKSGLFNIGLKYYNNAYLSLKNCFVGASGVQEQGVTIDGTTYSHIVNPFTGSAVNLYDFVFVVGSNGALVDALSTCFMMLSVNDIKQYETTYDVQTLIYKNNKIFYKNKNLEVKYH